MPASFDAAPDRYRLLFDVAVPTGIRQGELLGLTWADLDTARGALTVRMQLDRHGNRVALKTRQARREIELPDSLVKALREHKAATLFSQPEHFVLSSATDGPMHYRNVVRRELEGRGEGEARSVYGFGSMRVLRVGPLGARRR